MVGALLFLQLAAATPSDLASARHLLEVGDTVTAARVLADVAGGQRLTPEALASVMLLGWIARGAVAEGAAQNWGRLLEPQVRLRQDVKRGRLVFGGPVEDAVGDVFVVWDRIIEQEPDSLVSWVLSAGARPWDWREAFEATAAAMDDRSPLLAGAIRWLLLSRVLHVLDSVAAETPVTGPCGAACFRLGSPPREFRLLERFREAGQDTLLTRLAGLFTGLRDAPWPFDALGARAHVAVCALTRLSEGVAGCWPDGTRLGGREGAEVEVMVQTFRGRPGDAWQVMAAEPQWFASLDSLRDIIDPPARPVRPPRPYRYVPRHRPPADDRRLAVDMLWKAAWPLYLLPYNERLVVHRARLLFADVVWRLAGRGERGLFAPVGNPEAIVAVGVPLGVARAGDGRLLTYYPRGTHETAPETGRGGVSMPLDLALVATGSRGTRLTGFASEHYERFGPLDHQVVQYVRDGRRHVDVHTSWKGAGLCAAPRPMLGLFLLDDALRELRRTTVPNPEPRRHVQLRMTLHPAVYVYSLELFDPGCREAQRARYVLPVLPASDAMLSDLVLADELHYGDGYRGADRLREHPPATIRPSLDFPAGGTARFYWEMYGVAADSLTAGRLRIEFEIVNVREERVAVRDLGRVARDAAQARPTMDLSYRLNVPPGKTPLTSSLAVGLPAEARGVHVARLTVTDTMTGRSARAQRAFFVRG